MASYLIIEGTLLGPGIRGEERCRPQGQANPVVAIGFPCTLHVILYARHAIALGHAVKHDHMDSLPLVLEQYWGTYGRVSRRYVPSDSSPSC